MRRIMTAVFALLAAAEPSWAQDRAGGWVDVNFGGATAAEDEYTASSDTFRFSQVQTGAVAYSWPKGASFDAGGGYMFNRYVGVGVSVSGTAHEDVAGLAVEVPHPNFFNAYALDADVTGDVLQRAEGALHVQAMVVAAETPRVRLRVFGGPSRFAVEQDVLERITYDQVFQIFLPGNRVNILSYNTERSSGSAWGFHGGFDVSVFFTRVVGVGGLLRVSRARVELDDYGGVSELKVGGVQFGAGLRLRL